MSDTSQIDHQNSDQGNPEKSHTLRSDEEFIAYLTSQATNEDNKKAFDLGWDMAVYGMSLPHGNALYDAMKGGYNEAKSRGVKRMPADRFVRKWLHLRANALHRGKHYDESANVEFLRKIDVKRCPVTYELITHGSMTELDWSVDRVNNNASYAVGNITVVSSRANVCKGSFGLEEILRFAYGDDADLPFPTCSENVRPLTRVEWARWANICAHAQSIKKDNGEVKLSYACVPCVSTPPTGLMMNPSSGLQYAIAIKVAYGDTRYFNELTKNVSKPRRRQFNELIRRAEKSYHSGLVEPLEIWFNKRLFNEFYETFLSMTQDEKFMIAKNMDRGFGAMPLDKECAPNLRLESDGLNDSKIIKNAISSVNKKIMSM